MAEDPHNLRDLEALTLPEALLVWRRRFRKSQEAMARRLDVSMRTYTGWEYGTRTEGLPDYREDVYPLADHEVCFLYRRRAKKLVSDLAEDFEVTPYWITRIERGLEPSRVFMLLEYWEC